MELICVDLNKLSALQGPREEIVYLPCIYRNTGIEKPDYLATVDVDPKSPHYCQVIHRLPTPNLRDELHHSGWNTCSSSFGDVTKKRNRLLLPSLISSAFMWWMLGTDMRAPRIHKYLVVLAAPFEIPVAVHRYSRHWSRSRHLLTAPYLSQPVSAQRIKAPVDLPALRWSQVPVSLSARATHVFTQSIDLGEDSIPLEIRFLHNPDAAEGYVGCALSSAIHRFYKTGNGDWAAEKVVQVPSKKVNGWLLPDMPG
ncbi:LOW QUALITY PROTEIN: methanethiol oxidase-like [Chelonoidis abingdonii]|uniref:LOW QUALITY PROTEIN: methanethiol oxidase-like n=1 Tax=Chelonoidis abingdonii TaxID=106734 RepID=UPI003F492B16